MIPLKIAAAVGATTAASIAALQAIVAPEGLAAGAEHTLGAGAIASGLTWLALKDRVAAHDEKFRDIGARLDKQDEKLNSIADDVAFMRGQAEERAGGRLHTRRGDD